MRKTTLIYCILSGLLFSFLAVPLYAGVPVKGNVADNDNQPLIGVTVMEEGTDNNAAITDLSGNFELEVTDLNSVLVFSYIGYETVYVKAAENMEIRMEPSVSELDGVVVIGYGTSKRSDLTGSVSSLRSQTLEEDPSSSFTGMLAGRIPGVLAVSTGGAPGSKTNIVIRGASSVSGGTSPLYVVDGVMMGGGSDEVSAAGWFGDTELDPLSMINPDDVLSIEVLKDASATAIYGSRGANGVIIVTTKSGRNEQVPEVTFSYDLSVDSEPRQIEMLSGYEYENYMAELNPLSRNDDGTLTDACRAYWNEDGTVKHSGIDHNWQDEILRVAVSHNFNLSVKGGGKSSNYAVSAGYLTKDGVAVGSSMDRFTFSSKVNSDVKKWLKIGVDLKGSRMVNNGIISATNQLQSNVFAQMLTFNPTLEVDDSGFDLTDGNDPARNPLANATETVQTNISNRIQGLGFAEFKIMKGLTFKTSVGGYFNSTKSKNYYPSDIGPGQKFNGKIDHASASVLNIINENILNYDVKIKNDHHISAMLGATYETTRTDKLKISVQDLSNENLEEEGLGFGQQVDVPSNSLISTSLLSFLGRINYTLKDRYIFTASMRADGSSIFPEGNKFSYFPSGAFAWKISEEKFMKDIRWMDLFKLRLSYGQTGNQRIGALSSLAIMNNGFYSFNSSSGAESPVLVQGMFPASIGNDLLKWETTTQYNVGLDLSLFKGRLNITADAYYKDTRDLLITEQLPSISGYETAVRNIGRVTNKGLEFYISSLNVKSRNFTWNTDLNISMNRNVVEEIGTGDRIAVTPDGLVMDSYSDVFYVREGYPLGAVFGYVSDGLYQLSDFNEFYENGVFITDPVRQKEIYDNQVFTLRDGVVNNGFTTPVPGGFKPKKIGDSDSPVNPDEDRVYLGSSEPLFFGGLSNTFTYRRLSLYVQCLFSYGNELFNANKKLIEGRTSANISREYYENCWKIDRQEGTLPVYKDLATRMPSDLNMEDASYFKIKDITLSYTFTNKQIKFLKNLRIYGSVRNLLTFTKYSWYDPEYVHPNILTSALDRYSYPTTTTFLFGVSLTF